MPLILIPLALLALPLVEIGVFIWVGGAIGVWPTLALVIAAMVVGSLLLRRQTLSTLRAAQAEARAGRVPEREIVHGAMIALAGILLILPGFVTDVFGLLLFLPPVRDLVWRRLRAGVVVVGPRGPAQRQPGPEVIDLSGGEFHRRDGADGSPWTALDGPGPDPDDRGPRTLH
ncbi:membrane protein FxsA [Aureimonas flava]|uniref:Membrane protein FxsA n=1 Tax=Aureimonas flava TaxID=2320271 RepID=A0A3A1WMH9_9HYPH|nr:FxsA family protein [Aureimonas flava]RIY02766.1 membrane protein FxsA [Aureimonas flava]